MKKYCYFVGLLVIHPLISASYSSLTLIAKDHSPPLEQAKHTQAVIPTVQTAHDKKYKRNIAAILSLFWLWLLARFYATETSRRIPRWQLEDLALLKIIKVNALRLWNNHRPDRKTSGWRFGNKILKARVRFGSLIAAIVLCRKQNYCHIYNLPIICWALNLRCI